MLLRVDDDACCSASWEKREEKGKKIGDGNCQQLPPFDNLLPTTTDRRPTTTEMVRTHLKFEPAVACTSIKREEGPWWWWLCVWCKRVSTATAAANTGHGQMVTRKCTTNHLPPSLFFFSYTTTWFYCNIGWGVPHTWATLFLYNNTISPPPLLLQKLFVMWCDALWCARLTFFDRE